MDGAILHYGGEERAGRIANPGQLYTRQKEKKKSLENGQVLRVTCIGQIA